MDNESHIPFSECGFRLLRNRILISLSGFRGLEYQHIRGCVDIRAEETDVAQMGCPFVAGETYCPKRYNKKLTIQTGGEFFV